MGGQDLVQVVDDGRPAPVLVFSSTGSVADSNDADSRFHESFLFGGSGFNQAENRLGVGDRGRLKPALLLVTSSTTLNRNVDEALEGFDFKFRQRTSYGPLSLPIPWTCKPMIPLGWVFVDFFIGQVGNHFSIDPGFDIRTLRNDTVPIPLSVLEMVVGVDAFVFGLRFR